MKQTALLHTLKGGEKVVRALNEQTHTAESYVCMYSKRVVSLTRDDNEKVFVSCSCGRKGKGVKGESQLE